MGNEQDNTKRPAVFNISSSTSSKLQTALDEIPVDELIETTALEPEETPVITYQILRWDRGDIETFCRHFIRLNPLLVPSVASASPSGSRLLHLDCERVFPPALDESEDGILEIERRKLFLFQQHVVSRVGHPTRSILPLFPTVAHKFFPFLGSLPDYDSIATLSRCCEIYCDQSLISEVFLSRFDSHSHLFSQDSYADFERRRLAPRTRLSLGTHLSLLTIRTVLLSRRSILSLPLIDSLQTPLGSLSSSLSSSIPLFSCCLVLFSTLIHYVPSLDLVLLREWNPESVNDNDHVNVICGIETELNRDVVDSMEMLRLRVSEVIQEWSCCGNGNGKERERNSKDFAIGLFSSLEIVPKSSTEIDLLSRFFQNQQQENEENQEEENNIGVFVASPEFVEAFAIREFLIFKDCEALLDGFFRVPFRSHYEIDEFVNQCMRLSSGRLMKEFEIEWGRLRCYDRMCWALGEKGSDGEGERFLGMEVCPFGNPGEVYGEEEQL